MANVPTGFPARIWLRVDSLDPLVCSVRFRVDVGEGRLDWGQETAEDQMALSSSGAAGGLELLDLPRLVLVVSTGKMGSLEQHPLRLLSLPAEARACPGLWVEVEAGMEQHAESTDLVAGMALFEHDTGGLIPCESELVEGPTDTDRALVTIERDGAVQANGQMRTHADIPERVGERRLSSSSALVRSLVRRIRLQEAEITSLKKELAVLRSLAS